MAEQHGNNQKLWGGRFSKGTSHLVDDFHSSISFDQRLYREDIQGSIAHATMLGEEGIIPLEDSQKIIQGLKELLHEIEEGKVVFQQSAEDIHMNVESLLIEKIGEAGKRLHTGRSRNDQVALDIRLYAKRSCLEVQQLIQSLCRVLLSVSRNHLNTIMPGYTHLQKAQPITLAHHLMAYFEMFKRDYKRFTSAYDSADVSPLGSGALATTTYPLNRNRVAHLLGFSQITQNSLDGVSDRDFILEFLSAGAITMMHLSRFCEEIILWASNEFQFIEIDDAYATGSSIMPQKKNPDVAELIRGKTGRVYGNLQSLLVVMKGIPLAYNKDMQEDKESFFDSRDTLIKCFSTFIPMLDTAKFNIAKMEKSAAQGFTNATDCADYLVKKGLAFRDAHHVVGELVAYCLNQNRSLEDLSLDEYRNFSPVFNEDIFEAIALQTCVSLRNVPGGPAKPAVEAAIEAGINWLSALPQLC